MKNLFLIGIVFFGLAACSSPEAEEDGAMTKLEKEVEKNKEERERKLDIAYESMAVDMCGCFNDATSELTDEGRKVIEDAGQEGDMQEAMMAYAESSPENAMHDGMILQSLGQAEVMSCIADLEKKYDNVYTSESESQVQAKLILIMKDIEDCKLTYAFIKAGLSM